MAEGSDLACPEVRTAAGFKADNTARQSAKKPKNLGAAKLSFDRNVAIRRHSVNLENLFGDIEPDCRSFNHGTTSSSVGLAKTTGPLAHDAAGAGSFHNIKSLAQITCAMIQGGKRSLQSAAPKSPQHWELIP
jgi:hypothetical protein